MAVAKTHEYAVAAIWEGNQGTGTSGYASYGRRFRIVAAGKPDLLGTADPVFRGEAHLHNPEDLFVAALAACHMLTYLALCARHGVVVTGYRDPAHGTLELLPGGGGGFSGITLEPLVTLAPGSDPVVAASLHERAHALCFIARSCQAPIALRPRIEVEGDGGPPEPARGERGAPR